MSTYSSSARAQLGSLRRRPRATAANFLEPIGTGPYVGSGNSHANCVTHGRIAGASTARQGALIPV